MAAMKPRPSLAKCLVLLMSVFLATTAAQVQASANMNSSVMVGGNVSGSSSAGVKLVMRKESVEPGGDVRMRVDNGSGREFSYGLQYELARFSRGFWIRIPVKPVFEPRFVLQPGAVGAWQQIHIRRDARQGLYRVRKRGYLSNIGRRTLEATF